MMRSRRFAPLMAMALLLLLAAGVVVALLSGQQGGLNLFGRDNTWAKMLETEDFRVGLDPSFPPFESLDADGQPVGYDVDLAQALAERWGLEVKLHAMGYDSLVDAVMAARVDAVISAMPYDERLTRDLAISPSYFEAGLRLAVATEPPLRSAVLPASLAGRRVAVEWGSAGDMVARRLLREMAGEEIGAAASERTAATADPTATLDQADFEILQYDTPADAMDAVVLGAADAVLVDAVSLRLAQGQGAPLVAVGPVYESNPYVILSPRRAGTLAAKIEAALDAMRTDGTLGALEERWFGPAPALP